VEWDETEQGWMLALAEYRADRCPGCSGQLSETTAEDAERAFVGEPPHRCHKCTAIAIKQAEYQKTAPWPQALLWSARRSFRTKPTLRQT
jgi:hypothetical protein